MPAPTIPPSAKDEVKHDLLLIIAVALGILFATGIEIAAAPTQPPIVIP